jgi:predicted ATPase
VRIAISGTHRVGKTTLAEALAEALQGHVLVPEPYRLLEDEGHAFEDMPSLEDFEAQLERSICCLEDNTVDAIFDRCPLDLVAYLRTHRDRDRFAADDWLARIRDAMATLDLVVFVPIEAPDRVPVDRSEARLRAKVDDELRDLVLDDTLDAGVTAVEVRGPVDARLRQVLAATAAAAR